MSKGNMLLSQARGKVGDLVFSRLDGEQIVRSRNRHPKNPKTNAQLFQRAIMATVLRAYSAGKMIFDHAFEGKQVGAQCQRYFLSLNAKRLRAAIAADLEAGNTDSNATAYVVAPGVSSPVYGKYQVSEGSLDPSCIDLTMGLPEPLENEKIGEYAERVGLINGEFHTLVFFATGVADVADNVLFTVNGTTSTTARQTKGTFGYVRFVVDIAAADLDTVMTENTLVTKFIKVDKISNCVISDFDTITVNSENWSLAFLTTDSPNSTIQSWGIIRSIENEGLRSTCVMTQFSGTTRTGIGSDYLLRAWKQGSAALGDSDLILEGGDL